MILVRSIPALLVGLAALAACAEDSELRAARETRLNVYPDHYKADLAAAVHSYAADPTNIRDAYVTEPAIKKIGAQNRYAACVRFNAKNSDGRYTGSRDLMGIFVSGRFDQFVDPSLPGSQSAVTTLVKEHCGQADYNRFPELEALKR
jgi:hypothetical protein